MANSSWSHTLVWVSLAGALAGCSTVPDNPRPAGLLLKIPDAAVTSDEPVPQAEPPSRSGNADTYVVFGRRYRVKETSEGYREQGIASWYGKDFHGRKTSSGPPFNMFDLTAAHKSLPIPTYARVTNLENGRSTVVKINDRGPFVGNRLIDLSYAAADRLGVLQRGTALVEVAAVAPYQIVPKLAARRAEQRELLASRAMRVKPKAEATEIEFAQVAPSRSSAPPSDQPPAQLLASMKPDQSPARAPVRLASADEDAAPSLARAPVRLASADEDAAPSLARAPVRLASADEDAAPSPARAPVRLALAKGKRGAPKMVAKAADVKPARAQEDRNSMRVAKAPARLAEGKRGSLPARAPVRLALADEDRDAPKAVAKTVGVKPAKAQDDRNSARAGIRPPSAAPAPKGKAAVVKQPLPATNANRNGKPSVPGRQAGESRPMGVRLASLKIGRARGIAD